MRIKARIADSLADQIEGIQRRIASRAHEIWRDRGAPIGRALDDWLHAEQQVVWRPAIELRRADGAFVIEAAVAGVAASQLDVQASSTELLIASPLRHAHPADESDSQVLTCEFANGPLFRSLHFPEPVDPKRVKAEVHNGLLRVTAPLAGRAKVDVTAAPD